jgi:cobalt/nickel transport system permease protein
MALMVFTVEYAIGGNGAASVGTAAAAMVGVRVLIGIGEGRSPPGGGLGSVHSP